MKPTKTILTTDIKGHVKLISRVVGTPKKRISKAILSSRSEGTMSVTTFGCVYDLEDRPFLLFSNVKTNFKVSPKKTICFFPRIRENLLFDGKAKQVTD